MNVKPLPITLIAALIFCMWLTSCHSAKPAPHSYDLKGKILSVDQKAHSWSVEHGAIPGVMDAMTMDYPVHDDKAFSKFSAGDKIQATLKVGDDAMWLEQVQKLP